MKKFSLFQANQFFTFFLPLAIVFIIPVIFIFAGSDRPAETLTAFFYGPWSNRWFLGNTLDSMALLLTASLGALAAFRGGCFNLGSEGQIYLGGCAAAVVLLNGRDANSMSGFAMLFLAALTASVVGGLMGGVSGLLRKQFNANELITSFLLSAALIPVGDYLVSVILRNPEANLLATDTFAPERLLPRILPPSCLSVSIIIALAFVFLSHLFIHNTAPGYRFRIAGAASDLALSGGIDADKRFVPAIALSGCFAGLTGFFAVAGTYGKCYQGFSGGLGWDAIALAIIAGNEPLLLFPVVFVFSVERAGAEAAILQAGFGFETAAFIQAAILLLAALASRHLKGRGL
jgi:simple sugar transport system permease protein